MTDFEKHIEECKDRIDATLNMKGLEYARNSDRFHNFNRAASLLDVTPERALLGFWTKHIISVMDIINDLDEGNLASP